jgi:alpha-beta hydrolase superfamily lysophospholipase
MNWQRIRKWTILAIVFGVLVTIVFAWIVGGKLVAPASRTVGAAPEDFPARTIFIESDSGSKLVAWHLEVPESEATILLLHSVRSDRRSMLSRAMLLRDRGYSTLLVDLQAHGESDGDNITVGHLEKQDVTACVQYIRNRNPHERIAIVGRSLGGAAALLSRVEVDLLVIESVYPTIGEAIHNRVEIRLGPLHHALAPLLLWQLKPRLGISPGDLRPIDQLQHFKCPVLIASGSMDQHTTLQETKSMVELANEPKKFVIFEGVGHDDLLSADPEKYQNEIIGFIENNLPAM